MSQPNGIEKRIRRSSLGTRGVYLLRRRTPRAATLRILSKAGFKPAGSTSGAGIRVLPVYPLIEENRSWPAAEPRPQKEMEMGYTAVWLDKILGEVQADDEVLKETRRRRDAVLGVRVFEGALRSFVSGSIAHGTVITPVSDADGGGVLDRRSFPNLGPDGEGVGPRDIVSKVRDYLLPRVRKEFPQATSRITKRAIKFTFNEPLPSGEDPSVDLVVALTRAAEEGLWIPNTESDSWDASHPEKHTELLTGDPANLRVVRARVIRLAKAWNKQYSDPAVSSFNIEALALSAVKVGQEVDRALATFFSYSADDLSQRLTPDPAGVSPPIKCPDRDLAVKRLRTAAVALGDALANDGDEDKVVAALSKVFWDFVDVSPSTASKEGLAAAIRTGQVGMLSGKRSTEPQAKKVKKVRSFGDER